jgi:ribose transport system permease protein
MEASLRRSAVDRVRPFALEHRAELAITGSLLVLCVVLTFLSPYFLTAGNIKNLIDQSTVIGIIAAGELMVILTGGIDLSVGAIMAVSGVVLGTVVVDSGLSAELAIPLGILAALATGTLVGAVNGALVGKARLAPFIVTLGSMAICRGLSYVLSDVKSIVGFPQVFNAIASEATFLGIPNFVLFLFGTYLIFGLLLARTKVGRFIYSIGSNEEATRLSGVNVAFFKALPYVLCGFLCGLAVIVRTSRLMAVEPNLGTGMELDAIAACVVGGAILMGGKGTMFGTFIGVLLIAVLRNGLNLLGVSPYWQMAAVGSIIILSVLTERLTRERA